MATEKTAKATDTKEIEVEATEVKTSKKVSFTTSEKGVEVEFTASPTGKFNLGYNVGEKATFEKKQADILIEAGVAKKA